MAVVETLELGISWLGGLAACGTLAVIYYGLGRGLRRPVGRTTGHTPAFMRHPVFYLLASLGYLGLFILLWRPLPVTLSSPTRILMLCLGVLLYFTGLGLVLWGRLSLGKHYFVSSSFGTQLYQGHRLITHGPYALMRHPMYIGILLVGLGGIFLYRTWALVFFTLNFLGLIIRAHREEEALREEFGYQWLEYCQRVPRWLPFRIPRSLSSAHPSLSALLEVAIMFLPAIPAYLWIWPNLESAALDVFQVLIYLYVLAGTLWIGLRRWKLSQLGINKNGLGLSLLCGSLILLGRLLIILSIEWSVAPQAFNLLQLLGTILYAIALIGLVEELLYRGVIYRALEDWLGVRWAIWGSSVGFALWHIFGQGPLIGIATLFIGLLFALLRWRTGGIVGLIFIHALWDLETFLLVANSNQAILESIPPALPHPAITWLGFGMLLLAPIYLWLIYPYTQRMHNLAE